MVRVAALLAISVVALLAAAPALGGTVDGANVTIRYLAAPGETNDVVVRRHVSGVTLTDATALVVVGEGCSAVSAHEAFCPNGRRRGLLVRLDDMDDSIHVIGWFSSGVDDTVDYADRGAGVLVDLDGVADDGEPGESDTIANVENVQGGDGDDTLVGDAGTKLHLGLGWQRCRTGS